jgi:hypothetical protein
VSATQSAPALPRRFGSAALPSAALRKFLAIAPAGACLVSVAVLIAMELAAIFNHYAMRVTADTPTFMALIRDLAIHPLKPDSVFFGSHDTQSIHASPYLQFLGLIWRLVAPSSELASPMALGRFVGIVTIPVTLFVLGMLWLYTRALAGRTAAFISIPALLFLFGPVHIAFPSDLTINGFMSTGYFPTTFATGVTLATLLALRRRSWQWTIATVLLTALTLTTDPLNGSVLIALMIAYACLRAPTDLGDSLRVPLILMWAFMVADTWPAFDVFRAFAASGLPVPATIVGAFVAPQIWRLAHRLIGAARRLVGRLPTMSISAAVERRVALTAAWSAGIIAMWGLYTMQHWPTDQPILQTFRLGFYWNDQRDRWLLLLIPGACGLIGLLRLARRGGAEMLVWFAGFFVAGSVGAVVHLTTGVQLPFYYRFILLCQVPMAVGLAAFVAQHKSRLAAGVAVLTLLIGFGFKVGTLLTTSTDLSYFGARLPSIWAVGDVIPPGSGAVASDPNTSYFIPVAARDHVITLGQGHADSGTEPQRAKTGYLVMRQLYEGSPASATAALRNLWAQGVHWVIVEKFTSFRAADLQTFFAAPYNGLISGADVVPMARYYSRLQTVGDSVYDDGEFTVFRLDPARFARGTQPSRALSGRTGAEVTRLLRRLTGAGRKTAATVAPELYRLGVRTVTLTLGALGVTPQITAYWASIAAPSPSVSVTSGRWVSTCVTACGGSYPDTSVIDRLGVVVHRDPRFMTVVRLTAPLTERLPRHHR